MLKQLKNISYLTISQIVSSVSIFLLNLIWARGYSVESYGTYKLLITTISIFSVFALSGLNNTLIISSGKKKGKNFFEIFKRKVSVGLAISIILFIVIGQLTFFNDLSYFTIILISTLFPFYINNSNWRYYLQGNSNFKDFCLWVVLESLFVLTVVYICYDLKFDYNILICLLIGSRVLINNIFNFRVVKRTSNEEIDISLIKEGYKYTPGLIVGSLILFENYIIQYNLSVVDVAKYSIMLIFPLQIKTVFEISNKLLSKTIVSLNILKFWYWFKKFIPILILIYLVIGILGYLSVEHVINYFFGAKYSDIASSSALIFLIYSMNFPIAYLNQSLILNGYTKYHFLFQTTTTLLKLMTLFIFTFLFGMKGVIYVFIITTIYNLSFVMISFRMKLKFIK